MILFVFFVVVLADSWSVAYEESTKNWVNIKRNDFLSSACAHQFGFPSLRGGGAQNNNVNPAPHRIPVSNFQPPAALAGVPTLWRERLHPILQISRDRIQDSLLHRQAYKKTSESSNTTGSPPPGRRSESLENLRVTLSNGNDISETTPPPSSLMPSTAALSFLSLLRPSRIARLSLLAFVLAEVLDRLGILYEDTPSILKSQLEAFWYYDVEPTLMVWKASLQEFYVLKIRPYLPSFLQPGNWNGENLQGHVVSVLSTTKVAFTAGAALGMISSPVFVQWAVRYWKPVLAVYSLAEVNHYCKRLGRKLVQRLGDTPHTLGATLDGILEQCRHLVRRMVLGTKVMKEGSIFALAGTTALDGSGAAVSLLGGGCTNESATSGGPPRKNGKWWLPSSRDLRTRKTLGYSLGLSSSMTSATTAQPDESLGDMQGLVDEFKQWLVVHPGQNQDLSHSDVVNGVGDPCAKGQFKGEMMKHGFWAGCAIGLASLGI